VISVPYSFVAMALPVNKIKLFMLHFGTTYAIPGGGEGAQLYLTMNMR